MLLTRASTLLYLLEYDSCNVRCSNVIHSLHPPRWACDAAGEGDRCLLYNGSVRRASVSEAVTWRYAGYPLCRGKVAMAAAEKLHYWWACVIISLAVELRPVAIQLCSLASPKCALSLGRAVDMSVVIGSTFATCLQCCAPRGLTMGPAFRLMVSRIVVLFLR